METKLTEKKLAELEQIAMSADCCLEQRGGIDARNNDQEDFPEVSIWGIREMLEKAYRLGLKDGKKRV